jgi:hypothetical protein
MNIEPFANAAVLDRVQWRRAAVAFGLWLLGSFLVGLAVASLNRGHSSILFVMFGLAIGISGAVSHAVLLSNPGFRKLPEALKVLVVWAGTITLLLLLAAYASIQNERPYTSALIEAVGVLLVYCAPPALLAAAIISRVVKNAA